MISASRNRVLCGVYILLFVASGFSGLIYESVWTHYLKLFLGHAAYAQTLVLAIFMGGMAVGAWAVSRITHRIRNLLFAYAVAEGLIGAAALFFHPLFVATTRFSYDTLMPAIGSPATIELLKWTLAALLILPQSLLLGATFPLMSGGLIRLFPRAPGRLLATLYFANSIGAAAGVLVSGFVLIAAAGLPGTLIVAGVLNAIVAFAVWLMSRGVGKTAEVQAPSSAGAGGDARPHLLTVFLVCAAGTGAASFMYEVAWIRMLSLVLGSSTHAFEMMLSAFILGIALGGALIRRWIDRLTRPVIVLASVQIVMGLLAMLSILGYGLTFDMMGGAINALAKSDSGYMLFNLFSHGLCLLVMLPATICAGMTLPLLTAYLLTRGVGETAIGRVYAANTVGSILGVVLAIQLIMPWLGVKNLVIVGGSLDIALGLGLLWWLAPARSRSVGWGALAGAGVVACAVALLDLDPLRLASGVFRAGMSRLPDNARVLFHRDGKTASVDLVQIGDRMFIATNGKPDASLQVSAHERCLDEHTMILTGAIPWGMHPSARDVAVIGMGAGITTNTLLGIPGLDSVETIEIEPAMVEAARGFGPKVQRAFSDPRSRIHIDDAKSFFAGRQRRYDLIISEPSNPWVSGVGGLFSVEFYDLLKRHLADDGLLAQWIHMYEIDMPLVASVIKAIAQRFDDYAIYGTSSADILIVASVEGPVPAISPRIFEPPALRADLDSIGIRSMRDLDISRLGRKALIDPFLATYPISANSDYFPALDLGAVRARYLKRSAFELYELGPIIAAHEQRARAAGVVSRDHPLAVRFAARARQAEAMGQYFAWKQGGAPPPTIELESETLGLVRAIRSIHGQCDPRELAAGWLPAGETLATQTLPFLTREQLEFIWRDIETAPCFDELPPEAAALLALLRAIGADDHEQVAVLCGAEMSAGRERPFVVHAAMAAHIARGRAGEALPVWERHVAQRRGDIHLRWLAAQAEAKHADDLYAAH
jgi:predicted membrane-bound spermidine synthase